MLLTHKNIFMDTSLEVTTGLFAENDQTRISSPKSLFNAKINLPLANSGMEELEILEREPQ